MNTSQAIVSVVETQANFYSVEILGDFNATLLILATVGLLYLVISSI